MIANKVYMEMRYITALAANIALILESVRADAPSASIRSDIGEFTKRLLNEVSKIISAIESKDLLEAQAILQLIVGDQQIVREYRLDDWSIEWTTSTHERYSLLLNRAAETRQRVIDILDPATGQAQPTTINIKDSNLRLERLNILRPLLRSKWESFTKSSNNSNLTGASNIITRVIKFSLFQDDSLGLAYIVDDSEVEFIDRIVGLGIELGLRKFALENDDKSQITSNLGHDLSTMNVKGDQYSLDFRFANLSATIKTVKVKSSRFDLTFAKIRRFIFPEAASDIRRATLQSSPRGDNLIVSFRLDDLMSSKSDIEQAHERLIIEIDKNPSAEIHDIPRNA